MVPALRPDSPQIPPRQRQPHELGIDAVNEWTLQLLRVRHSALRAAPLCWYCWSVASVCAAAILSAPSNTHDRFGELIGATRVTTTRLLSKWRRAEMSSGDVVMSLLLSSLSVLPSALIMTGSLG